MAPCPSRSSADPLCGSVISGNAANPHTHPRRNFVAAQRRRLGRFFMIFAPKPGSTARGDRVGVAALLGAGGSHFRMTARADA